MPIRKTESVPKPAPRRPPSVRPAVPDFPPPRCALVVLLLWLTTVHLLAGPALKALERKSAIYQKIAARGNAATVGIYCQTTEYFRYYGTGALISADGYILTSTTVVPQGAVKIRIHLTNHRVLDATIVEINEKLESTLLKADGRALPFMPVAAKLPVIGENAYTFGNPHNMIRLGAHASFSVGNISGLYPVKSIDTQSSYAGLAIETDAAINPGQDGGPLLNSRGQLVGVISLSYSPCRWQGVAIPITELRRELKALRSGNVTLSETPLIEPLAENSPMARGLAGYARGFSRALIPLLVDRTHPPEDMPRRRVQAFLDTVNGFDRMTTDEQQELVNKFYQADAVLATNQHVRRPPGCVTGVVISADGYILTSQFNLAADRIWIHRQDGLRQLKFAVDVDQMTAFDKSKYRLATNRVKRIRARLPNGKLVPARIVARHRPLGLALLKVEARALPAVRLEDLVAKPTEGSACGVLGVAEGPVGYTLNSGMVSAADRARAQRFQFDAPINYGNSGGLILDRRGRILGLALNPMTPGPTMGRIFSADEILQWQVAPNSGVSFAARGDQLLKALPAMKRGKSTDRLHGAFVGFAPETKSLLADEVVLSYVVADSPAGRAGLRRGDIITKFNGRPVTAWKHILAEVDQLSPGDVVDVELLRRGRTRFLEINDQRIDSKEDLERLFDSLADGDEVKGRFIDKTNQRLTVKVKLGERK